MYAISNSNLTRSFSRHQHLATEGAACASIYHIKQGWACRYVLLPDGKRQITNLYLPGNYCEPQWLLSGRAAAPVMALTGVIATRVPLATIHRSHTSDVKDILSELVQSYERQTQWLVRIGRGSAIDRIEALLLELCERLEDDASLVHIPLTQVEIADIAGLTPVHTNRVFHSLAERGLIETRGRSIFVNRQLVGHIEPGSERCVH